TCVAEAQLLSVISDCEYRISYTAAVPLLSLSPGAVQFNVTVVEVTFWAKADPPMINGRARRTADNKDSSDNRYLPRL
ncbi:MAG: hypothetical protein DRP51_03125, partial [Candidatus Zixiibacteriota bacterium]